jgi:hypothetical protein
MTGRHRDDQVVTPTGWRITGGSGELPVSSAPPPHPLEKPLWGGVFRVHSRSSRQGAALLVREALEAWLGEVFDDEVDLDDEIVLEGDALRSLWWSPIERGGTMLVRHPHPTLDRQPCVTQLHLHSLARQTTLRVLVGPENGPESIRGAVGTGQLVPTWMTGLMDRVHYTYEGQTSVPQKLDGAAIPDFVEHRILDPDRRVALAVLSPEEEGDFRVEPEVLARELLGIAHLHVIERHVDTFALSDTVGGRHLSCYFGALRLYLPGFTRRDQTYAHPLILKERVSDPLMRASEFGGVLLGRASMLDVDVAPPKVWARAREAEAARREAEEREAEKRERARQEEVRALEEAEALDTGVPQGQASGGTPGTRPAAAPAPVLPDRFLKLIESQSALVAELRDEVRAQRAHLESVERTVRNVHEELEQVRTRMAVGGSDVDHIRRRLDRANSLLDRLVPDEDRPADLTIGAQAEEAQQTGNEILEIVREAREAYPEDLAILDSAEASARQSDYENPSMVETILGVMADVSRQRQEGTLGRGLRSVFAEYGLTYKSGISKGTPERLRKQHEFTDERGEVHFCEEHIAVGNSYDSRYCLRVYFTSRSTREPRFVVGHVGKHLETMSTT